jgi:hypothetical protein
VQGHRTDEVGLLTWFHMVNLLVSTQNGEYLDHLVLKNVEVHDSGMYICFVTSNGIGKLTYKAVFLNVVPGMYVLWR